MAKLHRRLQVLVVTKLPLFCLSNLLIWCGLIAVSSRRFYAWVWATNPRWLFSLPIIVGSTCFSVMNGCNRFFFAKLVQIVSVCFGVVVIEFMSNDRFLGGFCRASSCGSSVTTSTLAISRSSWWWFSFDLTWSFGLYFRFWVFSILDWVGEFGCIARSKILLRTASLIFKIASFSWQFDMIRMSFWFLNHLRLLLIKNFNVCVVIHLSGERFLPSFS